jgi:hypothetical protein
VPKIWGIVSCSYGPDSFISSSIGKPYNELRSIAKRMNRNGEGQRYAVKQYLEKEETLCPATE